MLSALVTLRSVAILPLLLAFVPTAPASTPRASAAPSPPAARPTTSSSLPRPIYRATSYGAVCNGIPLHEVGAHDDTSAIQAAILAAEQTGGSVLLPKGTCELSSRLTICARGPGITLSGTLTSGGRLLTTITNSGQRSPDHGALVVCSDHNTVENLTVDQHLFGETALVAASYTTFFHTRLLGGPRYFAVAFGHDADTGTRGEHNRLLDSTVVSLIDRFVEGNPKYPCDDAIAWAYQDHSLIQTLTLIGTRLALFQDDNSTVDGFTYYPGPQTCVLDAYWITQPSSNITLHNLTLHGSGGDVGFPNLEPSAASTTNIVIDHERVLPPTPGPGFRLNGPSHGLVINNVQDIRVENSNLASGSTANDEMMLSPTFTASGIDVSHSTIPHVRFVARHKAPHGQISNVTFSDDLYPPYSPPPRGQDVTFVNASGAPTTFSIAGGTWLNLQATPTKGFFSGANTKYTVRDLAGYSQPAYVQGRVMTTDGSALSTRLPSPVIGGDLLIVAVSSPTGSVVRDNQNGPWTEASANKSLAIWYKTNAKAGDTTITVVGKSSRIRIVAAEYLGIVLPTRYATGACNHGSTTAASTGRTRSVLGGDLVFAAVADADQVGSMTVQAGKSDGVPAVLRLQTTNTNGTIADEDVTSAPAGVQDATMTVTKSDWNACASVFTTRI